LVDILNLSNKNCFHKQSHSLVPCATLPPADYSFHIWSIISSLSKRELLA